MRRWLERLFWGPENPSEYEVTFISRGAPGDVESVRGDEVVSVKSDRMILSDGRVIPHHRVIEIRLRGTPVWRSPRWSE